MTASPIRAFQAKKKFRNNCISGSQKKLHQNADFWELLNPKQIEKKSELNYRQSFRNQIHYCQHLKGLASIIINMN